jgi:hypothetical protein
MLASWSTICERVLACSSCGGYLSHFEMTLSDMEEDLVNVRSGKATSSRYNLDMEEASFRESFDCVQKVCSTEEKRAILRYWERFMEIRKSGELKNPRVLIDPRR